MKGRILLLAAILFIPSNLAFATLGPVHVELNMIKPKLSAARANTPTGYKIYFRYNVNIRISDWIKIWLPIDEYINSDNPDDIIKQICDGLPKIDEKINNPRFVPNEEYFKKYDNPELKKFKQIYEITDSKGNANLYDCPDLSNVSNWGSLCDSNQGRYRIVKDPSGLGCWMLGTVFPSMPIDYRDRLNKLKKIIITTPIGYSPQSEEMGYPILVNTCSQRSYQMNTPLEIEAWRKGYNSYDWNCYKQSGFIAPATPGRYRLAIATLPEPEPVESEAFVLPCSDISDVKCKVVNDLLSVNFKTGEGGALDGGSSMVTLKLPQEIVLPKTFQVKSIRINGAFITGKPTIDIFPDHNELKLVLPSDIPNLGSGKIEFLENSEVTIKKTRSKLKLSIASTSEPNFIESNEFSAFEPYTQVTPNVEFAQSSIKIRTVIPEGKAYPKGTEITLTFPEGFKLPAQSNNPIVQVNGSNLDKPYKIEGQTLTISSPVPIDFNLDIKSVVPNGFTNPAAGKYKIGVSIDGTSLDAGEFELTGSIPFLSNLELSEYQGSVESAYEFDYQSSIKNMPEVGDVFSIIFPEGTKLPSDPDPSKVTIDGKPVISIGVKGQTLKIGSPIKFVFGKSIHFAIGCGINNPRKHGPYTLSIGVGEAEPAISEEYLIEPSPLKSWIYFKDPDKPTCGEWFNKPPILGFDCLNPDAKITFWFNNQPERDVIYGGEARMMPGTFQTTISWQAEFNGVKEEPQTIQFNLDTIGIPLAIINPKSDVTRTSKKTFTIKGEREFTEMLTDGDNTKFQVVDSVFLRFNGEETQLLEGEIYETVSSRSIKYDFEKTINLQEGENIVEIIGRDQACNETIVKRVIIFDDIPPKFEIVSPKEPFDYMEGDDVLIRIKTEYGAVVAVNKQHIDPELGQEDGVYYSYIYTVGKGVNVIKIEVSDSAGNKSSKTITFTAMPKQTVIVLTIDKTEWTVDGVAKAPMKVAPINKFTDPKLKILNGTTFMQASIIAPYFNFRIIWTPVEKKMTIVQNNSGKEKTIEVWLGKTTAKVDGKEVRFDSKGIIFPFTMNGSTMLPFRWFAENLGANVEYDAKTKTITLRYPK